MDVFSKKKRSEIMSKVKGKDTTPELAVRSLLHRNGYRFRLHDKTLPGKPDIVLKKYNTVIFVHGCFWHGHVDCFLSSRPKSRRKYWDSKIDRNIQRDKRVLVNLLRQGWRVLSIWECSMVSKGRISLEILEKRIIKFIEGTKKTSNLRGKHLHKI